MKEELIKLRDLREQMESLKVKKQAAYNKYLLDNDELFKEIINAETQLTETGDHIKELAMVEYQETGEKKLKYGVGIRVFKKLEYEELDAIAWAKEHNMALSLDKTSFEKIARADPMDFVKINEVPQATLPFKIEVE